jgi:hypothetical protein
VVLVMFYVDDGFLAAKSAAEADALVDLEWSIFEVWKFREQEDVLGIHIRWDRSTRTIIVDKENKALVLAAKLGVLGKFRMVPMHRDDARGVLGFVGGTTRGAPN